MSLEASNHKLDIPDGGTITVAPPLDANDALSLLELKVLDHFALEVPGSEQEGSVKAKQLNHPNSRTIAGVDPDGSDLVFVVVLQGHCRPVRGGGTTGWVFSPCPI